MDSEFLRGNLFPPFITLYRGHSFPDILPLDAKGTGCSALSLREKENAQTCRWRGWRKQKAPCPFLYRRACACAYAYVCASSSSSCAHGGGGDGGHCVWRT